MTRSAAFWDSSALIPLCVNELASRQANSLLVQWSPAVWWGTAVEIQSAFGRLKRTGGLQDAGLLSALLAFSVLQDDWLEIAPTFDLRGLAVTLVSKHPLRAADSLQLAAALVWCQRRPAGRTFISGDLRLCQTASLEGFTVIQVQP